MKRVCKQCGRSFELSESEIAFYKSKNLNLPKRCKACRQANKRGQAAWEERDWNEQEQDRVSGRSDHKVGKWVYALIVAALLFLFGLIRISNWYFSPDSARQPVAAENAESGTDTLAGKEKAGAEELPQNETVVAEAALQEGEGLEEAAALQEASDVIQDSVDTEAVLQPEADNIPEQPQSEADTGNQYTFRNSKLLNEHFEKHGKEMGFSSAEEYLAAANAVVNNASALHKTEKEDGDDVYYLESTNEFVIVSTDGFIRTYFCPNAGIDYYNRQ